MSGDPAFINDSLLILWEDIADLLYNFCSLRVLSFDVVKSDSVAYPKLVHDTDRSAPADDLASVHDDNVVGYVFCLFEVVGGHDNRSILLY